MSSSNSDICSNIKASSILICNESVDDLQDKDSEDEINISKTEE